MDTLKTAVVVVLLLAVLYGVYVVLNKPGEPLPDTAAWQSPSMEPLQVDIQGPDELIAGAVSTGDLQAPVEPPPVSPWQPPSSDTPVASPVSPEMPPAAIGDVAVSEPPAPVSTSNIEMPVSAPPLFAGASPAETETPTPPEVAATTDAPQPVVGQWPSEPAASDSPSGVELASSTAPEQVPPNPIVVDTASAPAADSGAQNIASAAIEPGSSADFSPFASALEAAKAKVESQEWYDALWSLSLFYGSPDLTNEERQQLQDWLDPLAAKVIYSREHLIEQGYQAQPGDTLETVSERYGVPWQLLANINGISGQGELPAGTELKVLRGPLRAEVDLSSSEMTLFAGKLYAGRFPLKIGQDQTLEPGEYRVLEKMEGRTYYAGDGLTIPPGDANNPYGKVWLDLGNNLCIHGSPAAAGDQRGCIGLESKDANDVFGILSKGSNISILR